MAGSVRIHVRVRGQVQGVGFRPYVYRLATELNLSGFVRNDAQGVEAEVQGSGRAVEDFLARLPGEAPGLARIDGIEHHGRPPQAASGAFLIEASRGGPAATGITPDTAVCPDCLAELFDPADRRWRYPFINCTHCGPRYTIAARLPYDRPHTSMARFRQCPACQAEYDAPADRRFHAQPNACPACGPRLWLRDGEGREVRCEDPVAAALARLKSGQILALRGIGGFHLACDARRPDVVARLRARKQREEKPFAVMALNAASLSPWADCDAASGALLASPERPVVLVPKRDACDRELPGIAPGIAWLGAVLPYAPLHYLLFHEAAGRPAGTAWLAQPSDLLLVMTSANPHGEPLAMGNDEAVARLAGIADAFLLHDRDILARCDDSVTRIVDGAPAFIRRARGYTPRAIRLPAGGPSVLACGGFFKNTVCVTRGEEAFLSPHIGELDNRATCEALEETVHRLLDVLEVEPTRVAHDLHPDIHASRFAAEFALARRLPAVAVQHHHAHIAAVAAEHRLEGPILGLALDGVGLGDDGAAWGGEMMRVEARSFIRLGSLAPLPLPGGDRAAREPWRMAAAALHRLGRGDAIEARFPGAAGTTVRQMLERNLNSPLTSSAGRLFDAAAGLLGVKPVASFEGQAAMLLEGLAARHGDAAPSADGFRLESGRLDFLPLLARLTERVDAGAGAALFHATLAEGLAAWVMQAAEAENLSTVALGGGCFLNAILSRGLRQRLGSAGLTVLEARAVPPNDGGLSLGQAWVAMNREF